MKPFVLIWGGGDLATGVALRLYNVGLQILMIEQPEPKAVRRSVSFAQAVYDGSTQIEGVIGERVKDIPAMLDAWREDAISIMVDPELMVLNEIKPLVLVDARMQKKFTDLSLDIADLVIGLGPGFTAGENCHAAIETNRGHFLGRVYWEGSPEPDTGIPGQVLAYSKERVLHAPVEGFVKNRVKIGDLVQKGDEIMSVEGVSVQAPFNGLVRGLIHDGLHVGKGMKIGDIDPRPEIFRSQFVSEKSLAIAGGVLEAIMTCDDIRSQLWGWE